MEGVCFLKTNLEHPFLVQASGRTEGDNQESDLPPKRSLPWFPSAGLVSFSKTQMVEGPPGLTEAALESHCSGTHFLIQSPCLARKKPQQNRRFYRQDSCSQTGSSFLLALTSKGTRKR